jgi:hypothetical protein
VRFGRTALVLSLHLLLDLFTVYDCFKNAAGQDMFFSNIMKIIGTFITQFSEENRRLVRKMEKVNSLVRKIYLTIYYINNLLPTY